MDGRHDYWNAQQNVKTPSEGMLNMAKEKRTDTLGVDLLATYRITDGRHEDVDADSVSHMVDGSLIRDWALNDGINNAVQAVIHRIKTVKGELADLGHPEYGSRHHELIGQPNTANNRNLIKLYLLQALAFEARIEKIHRAGIDFVAGRDRDKVNINLTLSFIGDPVPHDMVIPFNFSEPL